MTKGNHLGPVLTTAVFWATAGTHLKDGVLHITDLYAGAVVCGFAGEKRFEPEQEHTHKKQRTRLTNASMVSKKLGSYHPCVACDNDINVDFLA